jgi:alanyl-tRNA synthetase
VPKIVALDYGSKRVGVAISDLENKINNDFRDNYKVSTTVQDFEEARENGATALFGEKYEDKVRVVDIAGFSMELCGGTHVSRTGDIGILKIISEASLSTGVRRIEAITGQKVINRIHYIDSIIKESKNSLKANEDQIIEKTLCLN